MAAGVEGYWAQVRGAREVRVVPLISSGPEAGTGPVG